MNVVEKIITNKKKIVAKQKKHKPLNNIRKEATDYISTKNNKFLFEKKIKENNTTKLIAEFKPASPSQGKISNLTPEEIIPLYESNPVDMISVLTEESYFKSNITNFQKARKITTKPLLRKDFVIDKYMLYESALNDANCVLLINGVCPNIEEYLNITKNLGLNAIIECHSLEDIEEVVDLNPKIIGINNRNLSTLEVDLDTTKELREYVPNYLISESGVQNVEDAALLKSYGADAILIGTSILKGKNKDNIKDYLTQISQTLKK